MPLDCSGAISALLLAILHAVGCDVSPIELSVDLSFSISLFSLVPFSLPVCSTT